MRQHGRMGEPVRRVLSRPAYLRELDASQVVEVGDVDTLAGLVATGGVVVLSGAGLSTDSGIPDYRGPQGALRRHAPMTYQDFTGSPRRAAALLGPQLRRLAARAPGRAERRPPGRRRARAGRPARRHRHPERRRPAPGGRRTRRRRPARQPGPRGVPGVRRRQRPRRPRRPAARGQPGVRGRAGARAAGADGEVNPDGDVALPRRRGRRLRRGRLPRLRRRRRSSRTSCSSARRCRATGSSGASRSSTPPGCCSCSARR